MGIPAFRRQEPEAGARRLAILPLSIKPAGLAAFDVAIATDAKTTFRHF
jgi:hypothetical protein